MAARDGAAKRRRDRRLRSFLRHEQASIVVALASALHHGQQDAQGQVRCYTRPEDLRFVTGVGAATQRGAVCRGYPAAGRGKA